MATGVGTYFKRYISTSTSAGGISLEASTFFATLYSTGWVGVGSSVSEIDVGTPSGTTAVSSTVTTGVDAGPGVPSSNTSSVTVTDASRVPASW